SNTYFFIFLVTNAEDNEYLSGVAPSLEFLVTSNDVTGSGASSTLLIFNNEKGFSPSNVESICRVGKSTKKGNRDKGYIGEKGIGFKSVFLISSQPHIFSNGYQIKFNEKPCAECNIGYIVPEWVESKKILPDIKKIYGRSKVLPTTTIILPLKDEKVSAVKQQLSSLHPEMLLFLSKIRRLSVQEANSNPKGSTVSEIAISSEKNYQERKNMHAESYTVHLSAQENGKEEECGYYMWRQKFPVKPENRVDKRAEIDEWVITLTFPHGERLSRGKQISPGVYAFLPTEMVTNFPFIIQADFLLASSREAILFDSPWNKGILDCIPSAFLNAFVALVKSSADAPAMSLVSMFNFLPANPSIPVLEPVRSGIKNKILVEDIVPCESHGLQKIFCKPGEVGRLKPAFWSILSKARESGVDLKNLSTHGSYILSSHFDKSTYNTVLSFLGVKSVSTEWYAKCIEGSNLVKGVNEQIYLEVLSFVADNWQNCFSGTNMMSIPLLKYVDRNNALSFWSISRATQRSDRLCIASEKKCIPWLISWNREFTSSNRLFVPPSTQEALQNFAQRTAVTQWLQSYAKVEAVSVYSYGLAVVNSLNCDRRPAIAFAHFLYQSAKKGHIESYHLEELCRAMPVIDSYGSVIKTRSSVLILVPAKGSKWVGLMGTNPWRNQNYIELSADYKSADSYAGIYAPEDQLLAFLKT
uniref:Sacsin/Nov domain-containing protein n=1 Tax=Aegilops tauschii subsp. strangulata TaxID=200361 RepID=A0A453D1M8_AEGTS